MSTLSAQSQLASRLDHVALAVPDLDTADRRWRDQMGGRLLGWNQPDVDYRAHQLRYREGGKLELIAPTPTGDGGFIARFLNRFGQRIHHVTVKVPDLHRALETITGAGLDVVDVDDSDPRFTEAFLRPSQVGGVIIQVVSTPHSDEEWARWLGHTPQPPPDDAAILHGPLLSHTDLEEARRLWTLIGADVDGDGERLICTWDECPLDVIIEHGATAGPVGLRFSGVPPAAADYASATTLARS